MKKGVSTLFSFILIIAFLLSLYSMISYLEFKRDAYNNSVKLAIEHVYEKQKEKLFIYYNKSNSSLTIINTWNGISLIKNVLIFNSTGLEKYLHVNKTLAPKEKLTLDIPNINNKEIVVITGLGNILKVNLNGVSNIDNDINKKLNQLNIEGYEIGYADNAKIISLGSSVAALKLLINNKQYNILFNTTCGRIISINNFVSGDNNIVLLSNTDNTGYDRALIKNKIISLNNTFNKILYIGYNFIIIGRDNIALLLDSDGNILKMQSYFNDIRCKWINKDEIILYSIGNITLNGINVSAVHIYRFSKSAYLWNKLIILPRGNITDIFLDSNNKIYIIGDVIIQHSTNTISHISRIIYGLHDSSFINKIFDNTPMLSPDKLWGEINYYDKQNWYLLNSFIGNPELPLIINSNGYALYDIGYALNELLVHTYIKIGYLTSITPNPNSHYVDLIIGGESINRYYAIRIKHTSSYNLYATIIKFDNNLTQNISQTYKIAKYYNKPVLDILYLVRRINNKTIFRITICSEDNIYIPQVTIAAVDENSDISIKNIGYVTGPYSSYIYVWRIAMFYNQNIVAMHTLEYPNKYVRDPLDISYIVNGIVYIGFPHNLLSKVINNSIYFIPSSMSTYKINYRYLNVTKWVEYGIYQVINSTGVIDQFCIYKICNGIMSIYKLLSVTINNITIIAEKYWLSDDLVVWAIIDTPQGIRIVKVDKYDL